MQAARLRCFSLGSNSTIRMYFRATGGRQCRRTASAVWNGSLKDGKGSISTQSSVLSETPYSFVTRFENGKGTNPEELIAAAHAGLFLDGALGATRHDEPHAPADPHDRHSHSRKARSGLDDFENPSRCFRTNTRNIGRGVRVGRSEREGKLPRFPRPQGRDNDDREPRASCLILPAIVGLAIVLVVLWDAFETVVLPRRVARRFRLARLFYVSTWAPWRAIARLIQRPKQRETFLSYYGPLSLLFLFALWAALMILGFGFLYYSASDLGVSAHAFSHLPLPEWDDFFHTRPRRRHAPHLDRPLAHRDRERARLRIPCSRAQLFACDLPGVFTA